MCFIRCFCHLFLCICHICHFNCKFTCGSLALFQLFLRISDLGIVFPDPLGYVFPRFFEPFYLGFLLGDICRNLTLSLIGAHIFIILPYAATGKDRFVLLLQIFQLGQLRLRFIELRGVGIINARRIFGMGAVKMTEKIDMVVQLEPWDNEKVYDRLGLDNEYVEILGINIPLTVVPVKPGRNLSIIIEAAAMNNRQKKMGYNAARELLHSLGMTDDIVPEKKELEVWHDF